MIFDLLQFGLGPRLVTALESVIASRLVKTAVLCTLAGYGVLFFWEAALLIGFVASAPSRSKPALSQFWRIAVVAFLVTSVHLRMTAGS
jgi:hypothetical protein